MTQVATGADEAAAWQALLAAARGPDPGSPPAADALLQRRGAGWCLAPDVPADLADFIDLYLPLCQPVAAGTTHAVGHLGQSLDGYIATATGESCFVTGAANITHLHRLRALADAVLVGAGTVARDDPRLTTRRVPGPNPVRVVLDPQRRLGAGHRVFTDGAAPTLLCCLPQAASGPAPGAAEVIGVAGRDGGLDLPALLAALRQRALARVFVEGGGVTVSGFLEQGLLQRLQVAVAPVVIGQGRPGVTLGPRPLAQALRPPCRVFQMGEDVLFDLDLGGAVGEVRGAGEGLPRRVR